MIPIPHECTPGSYCRLCDVAGIERAMNRKTLPSRGECEFLGKRTEFRAGCGGRMCKHQCDHDEPEPHAIPGGNCQTCRKWESATGL